MAEYLQEKPLGFSEQLGCKRGCFLVVPLLLPLFRKLLQKSQVGTSTQEVGVELDFMLIEQVLQVPPAL